MHYQISFYVPPSHAELIKSAMFKAGAGKLDNYTECCWQTLGEGQFKPSEGSKAYIGEINTLEKVEEYKIEMLCAKDVIKPVIQALKSSHPYEMPAFSVIEVLSMSELTD